MTQELAFARTLADQAGAIMRKHFRTGLEHQTKGDGSPVTVADEAINALVLSAVREAYPADGVIGEEGSSPATSSGRVWVCDPIDGTMPFMFGMPTNLFSLALVDDGVPILGILQDPYLDRCYEGMLGEGATVNGQPLVVSDQGLDGSVVALPGVQFGVADNAGIVSDALRRGLRVLALGSVTYESVLVASGQLTACVFPGETVWDMAAIKVLVEEAGGSVTDIEGNAQRYDRSIRGALVSNRRAHADLVDLVRPHVARTPAG